LRSLWFSLSGVAELAATLSDPSRRIRPIDAQHAGLVLGRIALRMEKTIAAAEAEARCIR
jgi:hypothetical protein